VIARDDCMVVRTPANPGFWWGNFLLFDQAPQPGDAARWCARFDAEIAGLQPESRHVAFGVDTAQPVELPPDFARLGFTLGASTVLTMQRAQLRHPRAAPDPAQFRIEALALPEQAAQAVALQVATDDGAHQPVAEYRLFRERQMARYGAMERAGLGRWFGVFTHDGELVADCGLFTYGRLGRFQHVSTHPRWRRRGLCTALIHSVCSHGFETMGLDTLVIVADPDDVAIGLYESVGFLRGARTWQLERAPAEAAS
jgi:RimJ/RimL family protein N-acetyltransferase